MNEFQKKTIETAAGKVQSAKQALEDARRLSKSNSELLDYYRNLLRALEQKSYELNSNVEQASRELSNAETHYEYVCKEFAGIPAKPDSNFFVHFGRKIREAVTRF